MRFLFLNKLEGIRLELRLVSRGRHQTYLTIFGQGLLSRRKARLFLDRMRKAYNFCNLNNHRYLVDFMILEIFSLSGDL